VGALFQELFQVGVYKRSQGRITRQITFAAIAVAIGFGAWRMHDVMRVARWESALGGIAYWLPGLLFALGVWLAYRLVNFPGFADFLIAVEAEMNKVSWPSRTELVRASLVVLVMLVLMALLLYGFDTLWATLFWLISLY
jgi:preprotein translocase subunit SecE